MHPSCNFRVSLNQTLVMYLVSCETNYCGEVPTLISCIFILDKKSSTASILFLVDAQLHPLWLAVLLE